MALIAGELVCGVWFLPRPRSKALAPVWVFAAVSVVWSLLAVQAYACGLTVANCGCFGIYFHTLRCRARRRRGARRQDCCSSVPLSSDATDQGKPHGRTRKTPHAIHDAR
jgi:hypothetical protein